MNNVSSQVYCWPCSPPLFNGPGEYSHCTLTDIPTGSLYFSNRKGHLGDVLLGLNDSPYDSVGIILQTPTGTYVYCGDSLLELGELISDSRLSSHVLLPLKSLDQDPIFRVQLNGILKQTIKNQPKSSSDPYLHFRSLLGLLDTEDPPTSTEVIARILFKSGLIWDDSLTSDNLNPLLSFDRCFFPINSYDLTKENEVVVNLMTPKMFMESDSDKEKGQEDDDELSDYLDRIFNESLNDPTHYSRVHKQYEWLNG